MSKRTLSVPRLLIAVALAGLWLAIPGRADDPASQSAVAGTVTKAPTIPSEIITVNRFGVYPAEIVLPAGQFVLMVRNSRGSRAETFSIVPEGAGMGAKVSPVGTMATTAAMPRAMSVLNLPAGNYVVKFGNETKYSVKLTIK